MSRGGPKPPSQRQKRVAEEIRHALAMVLERGDLRDPVLASTPVTITEVRISPDLRNATSFVTPLGGGDVKPVLEALKRARSFLRHELATRIEMRHVPNLFFEPDTTFDTFQRIDTLLHDPKVLRDTHPEYLRPADDDDAGDEGDAGDAEQGGDDADGSSGDRHGA
ncbi:30S ribosome-binding factor RbfA [Novispirillum sp. DQ9]|uniref:30S ribosome-binding factor RbfA n=1 Tax=Novispirillum sp. DQ9 TaxID=3398612 RepID=UPI003C7BF593